MNKNRIYLDVVYDKKTEKVQPISPMLEKESKFNLVTSVTPVAICIGIDERTYYFERNDVDYGDIITRNPDIVKRLVLFDSEKDTIDFLNEKNTIHYYKDTIENINTQIIMILKSNFIGTDEPINIISDCDIFILSNFVKDSICKSLEDVFEFKFITYDSVSFMLTTISPSGSFENTLKEVQDKIMSKDIEKPCMIHMTNIKAIFEDVFFKFLKP